MKFVKKNADYKELLMRITGDISVYVASGIAMASPYGHPHPFPLS